MSSSGEVLISSIAAYRGSGSEAYPPELMLKIALCEALDVPLSGVLREVSDQVADEELALEALEAPAAPGGVVASAA